MDPNWVRDILISLISFAIGIILGFVSRGLIVKEEVSNRHTEATLLLVVVTIVWAVSVIADILLPQYDTNPLIHGLMGSLVGFYFYKRKAEDDKNKGNSQ